MSSLALIAAGIAGAAIAAAVLLPHVGAARRVRERFDAIDRSLAALQVVAERSDRETTRVGLDIMERLDELDRTPGEDQARIAGVSVLSQHRRRVC